MPNYVEIVGNFFPGIEVVCFGDPYDYASLQWSSTILTQQQLDDAYAAGVEEETPTNGDILQWNGSQWVSAPLTGTMVGRIHEIAFTRESKKTGNVWLNSFGSYAASNESPASVPWASKCVGITFTNSEPNVGTDIKIYKTSINQTQPQLVYTWNLRNARSASKVELPNLNFAVGDKISVYLERVGGPTATPSYPVIRLTLMCTADNVTDIIDT